MATSVDVSKANTTFALDLFKKLSEQDKAGNVFYSPISLSSALAMVMLGTRCNTAFQMSKVLRFTELKERKQDVASSSANQAQMQTRMEIQARMQQCSRLPFYLRQCLKTQNEPDSVHAKLAQLLSELIKTDAPYNLSIANRLYGEQSYKFIEDFLEETKKHYKAELESVDFKNNAEGVRGIINDWVEDQTQGKIKELLIKEAIGSNTVMVLVNAIYFKGKWEQQFKEEFTVDADFRINKIETMPVKMMCQRSKFRFTSVPEVDCQILEMPYQGKDLSMLIFLPKEIEDDTTGLEKLEKELTYDKFVEWTHPDKMEEHEVDVKVPRFKMEETYNLKDILISMGMTDVFDVSMSDFSGMTASNDLVLSKVVHKSFVEVNEEGTEAAAATAAIVTERSAILPVSFNADKPFLFYIRHNPTKALLFAGRYCSP